MEIELNDKAKPGDIIRFDNKFGVQAIVGKGCVFLLKYPSGGDWMKVSTEGYFDEFKEGKYKILAKSSGWKITLK